MAVRKSHNELAGNVAIIDGRLFPLAQIEFTVDHQMQQVGSSSMLQQKELVTDSTQIDGSFETYRQVEMPPHLGKPEEHTLFLFTEEHGTSKRVCLDGLLITGVERSHHRPTQMVDFIAKEVTHGA